MSYNKVYNRAYYKKHREKITAKQREYNKTHPKKYKGTTLANQIASYRYHMKRRGGDLTRDQLIQLIMGRCHYCGQMPSPRNGIDRIDSSIGYTLNNTVSCCKICNIAKGDMSLSCFRDWIKRLTDWQKV